MKKGLLLINLGTPDSTNSSDIKRYLRQFLTDGRVIDLPALLRYFLVYGLIVPFRSKNTAHAYQSIWTPLGSPLKVYSQDLAKVMQQILGDEYTVALGMRYGNPSIEQALGELASCQDITVLPLYPQYSSAATGSSIEEVMRILAAKQVIPSLRIIRDFYNHPAFITSQAAMVQEHLTSQHHVLFSYHGIPERHILKGGCQSVCSQNCPSINTNNQGCYRAQCYATSLLLAQQLNLNPGQYTTSFQSRLGKTPWIKPYTDEVLSELIKQGVQHLIVACPSFTVDCLETLEEIGMRLKEQWMQLGGKEFILVPCLNANPQWAKALIDLIQ
ncbi:ferrochelatase [Legionella worsleiensis]|uniref:Ferrochelatase n=1 Tax=Legionella worsleiensis TaxID=45076 RepID=A0A0W1AL33_9GAMM|nr:ferrochelatase [Legionella worsleiensis]KTD81896.1 ferrochelatase [Legionella worsleiensis]STY31201.1 ferrochelatase [Legionella worsleiensis]